MTRPRCWPCQRTFPAWRPGCFGPATDSAAIISSCSTNCRDSSPSRSSIDSCACPIIDSSASADCGLACSSACASSAPRFLLTTCSFGEFPLRVDFFMVVELSEVQVEDVENPHSEPTTTSTTNSTFNYVRDIAQELPQSLRGGVNELAAATFPNQVTRSIVRVTPGTRAPVLARARCL